MTKNTFLFVLMVLIGVTVYYFFQSGLVRFYDACEESKVIYDLAFDGIVVEKVDATPLFKDQFLVIKDDSNNNQLKLSLSHDSNFNTATHNSKFWEVVNVGDSVSKDMETFYVRYKHKNLEWVQMKLGFDLCP